MLFSYYFSQRFFTLIQSNFYVDFFLKKLCEVFVKNVYIYTALFFGEKYIIEVLTKKVLENFVYLSNKKQNITPLNFSSFFSFLLYFILYFVLFYVLLYFIF